MKDNQILPIKFFPGLIHTFDKFMQLSTRPRVHVPIYYLTDIPEGTEIDGDNPDMISQIMVYQGKAYWCEVLNKENNE
jgi:hypothetical protein